MRLLLVRHPDECQSIAGHEQKSQPGGYRRRAGRASVSLRRASADFARHRTGRPHAAAGSTGMSDTLPLSIANNRAMAKWLRFQTDRTVRLAVGKVEIGQGVLTALTQIAAEELDVAMDRFIIVSGDTRDAPDEGSTSSSQSIEMSGRSVRLISGELRARIVDRLARRLNCSPSDISVDDGSFLLDDEPTGHDYWNFAAEADFEGEITGT